MKKQVHSEIIMIEHLLMVGVKIKIHEFFSLHGKIEVH